MCMGSDAPKRQAKTPEAPVMPDASTSVSTAEADRRRRAAAGGASNTILTSSRGVTTEGNVATKTLLGQ